MPLQTIEALLSTPSPPLRYPERIPIVNSTSTAYKHMQSCTSWKDFTHQNMQEHLREYLGIEGEFAGPEHYPELLDLEYEKNVDTFFSAWRLITINKALTAIRDKDSRCPPTDRPAFNGLAMASGRRIQDTESDTFFPDWTGTLYDAQGNKVHLIPGDSKFTSIEFEEDAQRIDLSAHRRGNRTGDEVRSDYIFDCLGQVCAYAKAWNTRYAYIITNLEVIFIRISLPGDTTTEMRLTRERAKQLGQTPADFTSSPHITDSHKALLRTRDSTRWTAATPATDQFMLSALVPDSEPRPPLPAASYLTPSKRAPTSPAHQSTPRARPRNAHIASATANVSTPTSQALAVRTTPSSSTSRNRARGRNINSTVRASRNVIESSPILREAHNSLLARPLFRHPPRVTTGAIPSSPPIASESERRAQRPPIEDDEDDEDDDADDAHVAPDAQRVSQGTPPADVPSSIPTGTQGGSSPSYHEGS